MKTKVSFLKRLTASELHEKKEPLNQTDESQQATKFEIKPVNYQVLQELLS